MRRNRINIEKEEKIYYKQVLLSLLLISLLVVCVICLSFTVFYRTQNDHNYLTNTKEEISMTYTENTNGISIENALPVSDEVGMKQIGNGEYFDFVVKTTVPANAQITYEIVAEKDLDSTISDNEIKLYLEQQKNGTYEKVVSPTNFINNSANSITDIPKNSMILKKVTKTSSSVDNYRLKMWLDEKSLVDANNFYTVKINVYGISK